MKKKKTKKQKKKKADIRSPNMRAPKREKELS